MSSISCKSFIALVTLASVSMSASAVTSVNLADYRLVGRYTLPEPTRVTAPPNSLLAQEVSAVTWNRDTDTLFMVGDGGRSIVQVGLTGNFIDSMTLGLVASNPQGTAFYDPEGLAYVGNGQFVMMEERLRVANLFTYVAGSTLSYAGAQHVKLGTTIGNIGIEGISYDPLTSGATPGFIAVKEEAPMGVFQTNINFAAGTATNGSAATVNSTNLFDPTLTGLADIADVFSLSNLNGLGAADIGNLLLLSQASGKIIEVDRSGNTLSSLNIPFLPTNPIGTTVLTGPGGPLSVANQQHEGLTMDDRGFLYLVSENGGGDINNPQLWVMAPVPEPEAYAMMMIGLGVVGFAARHKAKRSA